MKCVGCGESLRRGQIVCPRCGTAQSRKPDTVRCAVCGEQVAAHLWVCPQCGHDLLAVRPRLWQRPMVRAITLAVLGATVLLIILISGVPHAGAERLSPIPHPVPPHRRRPRTRPHPVPPHHRRPRPVPRLSCTHRRPRVWFWLALCRTYFSASITAARPVSPWCWPTSASPNHRRTWRRQSDPQQGTSTSASTRWLII